MDAPPIWRLDGAALGAAIGSLADDGVTIVLLDVGDCDSSDELHGALASMLDFPSYYGRNLDALHDCLGELITALPPSGLALVFRRFDRFESRQPVFAEGLLEVIAEHVQDSGGALVCLAEQAP
jgi:RNAse (barnase) inhibitor barstar